MTEDNDITRTAAFAEELDAHLGQSLAALTPPNRAQRREQAKQLRRVQAMIRKGQRRRAERLAKAIEAGS